MISGIIVVLLFVSIGVSIYFTMGIPLVVLFIVLLLFNVFFFRDPVRTSQSPPTKILAPADGLLFEVTRDLAVETAPEEQSYVVFRIRMSLGNVHVNRMPLTGTLRSVEPKSGGFLPMLPWGSLNTQSNARKILEFTTRKFQRPFYLVQISGFVARRCVVFPETGKELKRSQRFGLIKYGSEVDLYLPQDQVRVVVSEPLVCRAGLTVLAEFRDANDESPTID